LEHVENTHLELEEHVWELDGNILRTTRREEKKG